MENPETGRLILLVVLGTSGMLVLVVSIIGFIIFYQKRYIKHQLEMEKTHSHYQKEIINKISETQEEERRRIANNLHDETGALLFTAKLMISQIEKNAGEETKETIRKAKELLSTSIQEIRRTVHALSPGILEKFGLVASIKEICDNINNNNKGLTLKLHSNVEKADITQKIEITAYRIAQEIINNGLKHADATEIDIHITKSTNLLKLQISDNGKGFNIKQQKSSKGMGLKNIETRLYIINGTYTIDTAPGKGCRYQIDIPLKE